MKYNFALLIFLLLTRLVQASNENIAIEIVDSMDSVLVYAPVYVTAAIYNNGPDSVLLPVNSFGENGWRFEMSRHNEKLPLNVYQDDRGADQVILLEPGAKFFFSYNLGPELRTDGVYEYRAVMESSGKCLLDQTAESRFKAGKVSESEHAGRYKCWSGTISTESKTILVSNPILAQDIQALEYIRSRQFYAELGMPEMAERSGDLEAYDFSYSYDILKKRFPSSYYTYVAGLYKQEVWANASIGILKELMEADPNHALAKQVHIQLARKLEAFPNNNIHIDRSALKIPAFLEKYIDQIKREREASTLRE